MKKWSLFSSVLLLVSSTFAQEFYTPEEDRHGLEPPEQIEEKLPRVLLIGDSISIAYTPIVRWVLKDEATVLRPNSNCGSTIKGLRDLDKWLGDEEWDVIHFNFGLHDLSYHVKGIKGMNKKDGTVSVPLETYKENLEAIVARLKKTGARLIWASTTKVPENEPGRFPHDAIRYNEVAATIMNREGIRINDLHALTETFPVALSKAPEDVHFKQAGSSKIGQQVAKVIRQTLNTPPATPAPTRSAVSPKPNILILFVDDLNASIQGMDMHPDALTPNIERLRKRGVTFQNAASNIPVCGPSRASVWSGLYPHTAGFFGQGPAWGPWRNNDVHRGAKTLFQHFRRHGYHIYAAGKIHHNGEEDFSIFRNLDGSDGYAVRADFGPMITNGKTLPNGKPVMMARAAIQRGGISHWDCDVGPLMANPPILGGTGSWVYDDGTPFHYASPGDRDRMPDEMTANQCVEWIQTYAQDKPFLMTAGFIRPHSPLVLPPEAFERFPLESIHVFPGRKDGDEEDTGLVHVDGLRGGVQWGRRKYNAILKAGGEEMLKKWTQAYLAGVGFVDEQIGKVLDALDASPHSSNTVVVLSSDHGYHMGDKELLHKFTLWESAVHIPMVVAGPGLAEQATCTKPVSLIDIYPTLIDLAYIPGEPNREGSGQPLDGHSLRPLLQDPVDGHWTGPDVSLSVISGQEPQTPGTGADKAMQHYSLRSETHRYIRWNSGFEELYDHSEDPHEWDNIASRPSAEPLLNTFRHKLETFTGLDLDT